MEWYIKVLRQYAEFNGRARRREYWMFVLIHLLILFVARIIDALWGAVPPEAKYGIVSLLYLLAVLIPWLAVSVRRMHDIGKSGKWVLIGLVPLVGQIWLFILLVTGSTGNNRYGARP
ncbi:MAG: DUF805 domain-containing protein [Prevotellaceae bacterium]|jgi:uncharacterized membrane protein YhaH (DUF805 family)|nr:DUF805 domain-containing protein [Prevotellaceae bacterium]